MKLKFTLISFLLIFLVSCAPRYSKVQLTPQFDDYIVEGAMQVVRLTNDSIDFDVDFLQATVYDLLFEINIKNNSTQELEIIPIDFNYLAINDRGDVLLRNYAFDPEILVFDIDQTIAMDRQAAKATKTAGWVVFGLNVLATAISIASDDEVAPIYAIEAGASIIESQAAASAIERHVVYLEGERDYYENAALRESLLAPGESLRGIVIFPRFDDAQELDFYYDISGRRFEITYRQDRTRY